MTCDSRRVFFGSLLMLCVATFGCGGGGGSHSTNTSIAHDFKTPEGAILSLEDAYLKNDIEAAVACKDFAAEAKVMLANLQGDLSGDPEILNKTIEVLELGFRAEMKAGFPDFRGIQSTFSDKKPYGDREDMVELTETCTHSSGTSVNKMHCIKKADGWKVVSIVDSK